MRKIIITGGLGYIGMELSKIYSGKSRNFDITVIDSNFFSERVSQLKRWGIKFKQIDILDQTKLKEAIHDADLIYHLAGITDVATTKKDINPEHEKKVKHFRASIVISNSNKFSLILFSILILL